MSGPLRRAYVLNCTHAPIPQSPIPQNGQTHSKTIADELFECV